MGLLSSLELHEDPARSRKAKPKASAAQNQIHAGRRKAVEDLGGTVRTRTRKGKFAVKPRGKISPQWVGTKRRAVARQRSTTNEIFTAGYVQA
jgi:hypothetical protein